MNKIAIITARGGSKRIPRKNIKDFLGKPVIAYSIETALKTELFSEIMVSTDDEEIAEIAQKYGAKVPFMRSAETSDDFAATKDVLEEVIAKYKKIGREFDYICCFYPTAPLIQINSVKNAFMLLQESDANMIMPVVRFSYPVQRAFKRSHTNEINFVYPEYAQTRSQDLEPMFHDSGSFYWYKKSFFTPQTAIKRLGFELSELEVQDIDTLTDWKIAELKYQVLRQNLHNSCPPCKGHHENNIQAKF